MAWDDALKQYGKALANLSEASRNSMAGSKTISIATNMVNELRLPVSPTELVRAVEGVMLAQVQGGVAEMPGATASVKRFHKAGLLLGIGTAMNADYVSFTLKSLGATTLFGTIVTGEQIQKGKPDPETYLAAAARLGADPLECVVFEDATAGIESAKNAGCYCIAITNADVPPQDTSLADMVVASWDEVTLAILDTIEVN